MMRMRIPSYTYIYCRLIYMYICTEASYRLVHYFHKRI